MLKVWWEKWGWEEAPTMYMLPIDGIMVYDMETTTPLYAGFLYSTGTAIGWLEFIISNKEASVDMKRGALKYLCDTLATIAKYKGMTMLFTSTNNPSLVQSMKKADFVETDKNVTQMLRIL
jgi:hypothetical protein